MLVNGLIDELALKTILSLTRILLFSSTNRYNLSEECSLNSNESFDFFLLFVVDLPFLLSNFIVKDGPSTFFSQRLAYNKITSLNGSAEKTWLLKCGTLNYLIAPVKSHSNRLYFPQGRMYLLINISQQISCDLQKMLITLHRRYRIRNSSSQIFWILMNQLSLHNPEDFHLVLARIVTPSEKY